LLNMILYLNMSFFACPSLHVLLCMSFFARRSKPCGSRRRGPVATNSRCLSK
jgi:hypothetical protein